MHNSGLEGGILVVGRRSKFFPGPLILLLSFVLLEVHRNVILKMIFFNLPS